MFVQIGNKILVLRELLHLIAKTLLRAEMLNGNSTTHFQFLTQAQPGSRLQIATYPQLAHTFRIGINDVFYLSVALNQYLPLNDQVLGADVAKDQGKWAIELQAFAAAQVTLDDLYLLVG